MSQSARKVDAARMMRWLLALALLATMVGCGSGYTVCTGGEDGDDSICYDPANPPDFPGFLTGVRGVMRARPGACRPCSCKTAKRPDEKQNRGRQSRHADERSSQITHLLLNGRVSSSSLIAARMTAVANAHWCPVCPSRLR